MTYRVLLAVVASFFVFMGSTTQAFATANQELDKAHECMKSGHCQEGFSRLEKLAKTGHPTAECLLGMCYQNGKGVPKDSKKAAYWFQRSAQQGHAGAQTELGKMYLAGKEIQKDTGKAELWLNKAAHQGVADAQYNLGKLYVKENRGYNKNINARMMKARRWILLARDQGVEDTEKLLDQIPGFEKAQTQIASRLTQSRNSTAQGMGNIQGSWEGYGDMVKTLRDVNTTASQ
ncbi:MAG TPA: tetratricopeptide repeat protein [Drouetiella sp.]